MRDIFYRGSEKIESCRRKYFSPRMNTQMILVISFPHTLYLGYKLEFLGMLQNKVVENKRWFTALEIYKYILWIFVFRSGCLIKFFFVECLVCFLVFLIGSNLELTYTRSFDFFPVMLLICENIFFYFNLLNENNMFVKWFLKRSIFVTYGVSIVLTSPKFNLLNAERSEIKY